MTIFTNPHRRIEGLTLQDFSAPTGDFLAARLEEELARTPTGSARRMNEVSRAAGLPEELADINRQTMPGFFVPEALERKEPLSPYLTPEQATDRGSIVGLSFNSATRSEVVDILVERKKREIALRNITSRSPNFTASALGFGTGLVAQALDPANIAAAFIPIVGEARFLQIAGRIGPTGARAARGAAEGFVGTALVEPIVLAAAEQEQADYDMMDSLLNITFGTFLGGGLHTAGGALSDALSRAAGRPTLSDRISALDRQTQEMTMRSAIAQLAEGRAVNIEPLISGSPLLYGTSLSTRSLQYQPTATRGATPGISQTPAATSVAEGTPDSLPVQATYVPYQPTSRRRQFFTDEEKAHQAARQASRENGPQVRVVRQDDGRFSLATQSQLEPLRRPEGDVLAFDSARAAEKHIERTRRADTPEKLDVVPFGPAGQRQYAVVRNATDQEVAAIRSAPQRVRFADVQRERFTPQEPIGPLAPPKSYREPTLDERIASAAQVSRDPRQIDIASFEASARAEEQLAEIPEVYDAESAQAQLTDAQQLAQETKEALDISDEVFNNLTAEVDEQITLARALGKAAKAAALCDLRR